MIDICMAKRFCKEDISKIENYDKAISDSTQTWDCHHRTAIWWNCTRKELIENECYYNRKACELIFLTHDEHMSLHHKGKPSPNKGKVFSEEHRINLSESHKGQVPWNKGKKFKKLSEETRRKISEAMKKYNAKKKGEI